MALSDGAIVPLTFARPRFGSGLAVTVQVNDALSNATLLTSQTVPEIATGAGVYTYMWAHGIAQDTECLVTYTVNGLKYYETITIAGQGGPGRAV